MQNRQAILERFERLYIPEPNSGCWLWAGNTRVSGYGVFKLNGKTIPAHRMSVILHCGDFDRSLFVCHKCDVPGCVNPDHLFVGTPKDNTWDMLRKGRIGKINLIDVANIKLALTAIPVPKISEMAVAYGISQPVIHAIRNGESWEHVKPVSGPVINRPPPPGKFCGTCREYMPFSAFYTMKTGERAGQFVARCTPCQISKKRERRNAV